MKKIWNTSASVLAALSVFSFVSSAFAQYGSGACAPNCEVPSPTYTPTCDVPTVPACEPTCDVAGYSLSCETPSCGYGCYNQGCFLDASCLITGALNAAVAPFKWIYCEFTDGIFPDCGCAAPPAKAACNPCTICGDYVGGCNDNCDGNYCPTGNECANGYFSQVQNGYADAYTTEAYSSQVYDVEQYDASPTRGSKALPKLPIHNNVSAVQRIQSFNIQDVVGNTRRASTVRPVGYEQNAKARSPRPVQAQALIKAKTDVQPRVTPQSAPNKISFPKVQVPENLQNKNNVRIVAQKPANTQQSSTTKSFGKTRVIK